MKKNPFLHLGVIALSLLSSASFGQTGTLNISTDSKTTISKHIYGQFAEHLGRGIYGGFWVDKTLPVKKQDRIRLDIVDALKKIKIPNLRWPGGCFADEYHWRDGIGPATARPRMVNTNWGGVTEDNSFGTHEFLELCDLLGCEPYIAGNVGSGTVDCRGVLVTVPHRDVSQPCCDNAPNGEDCGADDERLNARSEDHGTPNPIFHSWNRCRCHGGDRGEG